MTEGSASGKWLRDALYRRGFPINGLAADWGRSPGEVRAWFRDPDPDLLTAGELRQIADALRITVDNLRRRLAAARPKAAA
jgi:hypothetical protein